MMPRKVLIVVMMVGIVVLGAPTAWAQDPIHKMGRGLVNVLTCWIELPKQLHLGKQEDNPIAGMAHGLAKGVSLFVVRGGMGLYEAVTFPIPYPKGFASPYESMGIGDYAWE